MKRRRTQRGHQRGGIWERESEQESERERERERERESHVVHMSESYHTYITFYVRVTKIHMGWLRSVGSFQLYVSLENIGLFCRALLQKKPTILRSLLILATPYHTHTHPTLTCLHTFARTSTHLNPFHTPTSASLQI